MNLTLHLTENCNLSCTYCLREKCPRDMTEEVLYKACDLAFSKGTRAGLCFFGGEPLLKKDLIYKALDYCEAKSEETGLRFDCKMTTNGTLLDEKFLERARDAGMIIGLSFDGKAQDVCRRFADKNRSPSSSVVEEKARLLLKYIPDAVAMMTFAPEAIPYYSESVKYLHELGFCRITANLAYGKNVSWSDGDLDLLKVELEKTSDYLVSMFETDDRLSFGPLHSKMIENIKGHNPAEKCHLGVRQMPVTPAGDLYPCTSFIGDEDYYLGNVFDGVDYERAAQIAAKSHTPKTCLECDLVKRCTNSCGCANRMNTGSENEVSPLQCTYERMIIEAADDLGDRLYSTDCDKFMERFCG